MVVVSCTWRLGVLSAFFLLQAPLAAQVEETPSTAGLVAAYTFDEGAGSNLFDHSGKGNDGRLSGPVWTALGHDGGALEFDGVNDIVLVPDSDSLDLITGFTIEAWIYPTAPLSDWTAIVQKEVDAYFLDAASSLEDRPAVGATFSSRISNLGGGILVPLNTWTHLAGSYDGAALRIYMNGVERGSKAQTGSMVPSTKPLRVGGSTYPGEFFAGLIDEIRIYDHALSATEIQNDRDTPVSASLPPTIAITSPISGEFLPSSTVVVSFTLGGDRTRIGHVNMSLAGITLTDIDPVAGVAQFADVPDGARLLQAVLVDPSDVPLTDAGASASVAFAVDTIAPTVSITAPAEASTVSGTVTLTAIATDASRVTVQFQLDGADLGLEDTASPFSLAWDSTTAVNGARVLSAVARDAAGNLATSRDVNVDVSNTRPPLSTVGLDSVLAWDHSRLDVEEHPDLIVWAEVALSGYRDSLPGDEPLARMTIPSSGPGDVPLADLLLGRDTGDYRVWVRVRDGAGNWSDWSRPLDIEFRHTFIRGDANSSSEVDIADVVFTAEYLFLAGKAPECADAADSNDDGEIDISDPVYTLFFAFVGGPPPPPPFPRAGIDLTLEDPFDCDAP